MTALKFNKELSSKRQGNSPSVIFRKIPDTGNEPRFQGSINTKGLELIKSLVPNYASVKIVFSDQHQIIGFVPSVKEGTKQIFGATELFKTSNLNLRISKKYKLSVSESKGKNTLLVIDSDEFK